MVVTADFLGFIRNVVECIAGAVVDALDWCVGAFDWMVDALGAPSVAAWVLGIVGAGLLWHVWRRIRIAGVLGPMKVADLQADGTLPKVDLTARLRDELASKGLMPSSTTPAGSPHEMALAAVEASPLPQAAWVGKVLRLVQTLIPQVRQYDVAGALMSRLPPPEKTCGLAYTLSGSRTEAEYIPPVWESDYPTTVSCAASDIYMRITQRDDSVFPRWAQWRNREALDAYLDGLNLEQCNQLPDAKEHFATASAGEPSNALPVVRGANILEIQAALPENAGKRPVLETQALELYREAMRRAETLVQARYRRGVLAAGQGRKPLALSESQEAQKLLRPFYVLFQDGRLRTRYEPRGRERRRFRKAVRISYYCIRERLKVRRRGPDRILVWLVLVLRGRWAGWQARYNAACYYSLRRKDKPAFKHLHRAVENPTGVTRVWLKGDADLSYLRERAPGRWREVLAKVDA